MKPDIEFDRPLRNPFDSEVMPTLEIGITSEANPGILTPEPKNQYLIATRNRKLVLNQSSKKDFYLSI